MPENAGICGVCLDVYDIKDHRPRCLDCGHVFCQSCLEQQVNFDRRQCPECRKGWPLNLRVDALPTVFCLLEGELRPSKKAKVEYINVQDLTGRTSQIMIKGPQETVEDLRQKIFQRLGMQPEEQFLIYGGKALENGRRLGDYNIRNGDTMFAVVRLRGGTTW